MRQFLRDEFSAVAVVLALAALVLGVVTFAARPAQPKLDTSAYVRRSDIGLDAGAANQAANTRIREALRAYGFEVRKVTILSTRIAGDTATIAATAAYGKPGNPATATQDVTVILHRTVWQVDQMTNGLPAASRG